MFTSACTSSVASTSSITARLSCATISTDRLRVGRTPPAVRVPPSFSASPASERVDCSAGSIAKSTGVSSASARGEDQHVAIDA